MEVDLDELLNKANDKYEYSPSSESVNESKQTQELTEYDFLEEIERIKKLNLPDSLKESMLEEANLNLINFKENKKQQISEASKKENELLNTISNMLDEKLNNFFKDKIVLTENKEDSTEIGIVIDGMVFKGNLRRVK